MLLRERSRRRPPSVWWSGCVLTWLLLLATLPTRADAYYTRYSIYTNPPPSLSLTLCDDSVVAVDSLAVVCDSPYTFYYGNGANRNSIDCDYGDKATIRTSFTVLDHLQEQDTEIYVTMAVLDDAGNFLVGTYPEKLCSDYVGEDCTQAGSYTFYRKLKLGFPLANQTKFTPVVQMAFSTRSDAGYNLGAVNTECPDTSAGSTVAWSQENIRSPWLEFVMEYAILGVTFGMVMGVGAWVWKRAKENPGFDHLPPYHHKESSSGLEEMSFMEL